MDRGAIAIYCFGNDPSDLLQGRTYWILDQETAESADKSATHHATTDKLHDQGLL